MNESEFLTNSGFVELVENFKKEEIEVPHILRLDNSTLRELGVYNRCEIQDSGFCKGLDSDSQYTSSPSR